MASPDAVSVAGSRTPTSVTKGGRPARAPRSRSRRPDRAAPRGGRSPWPRATSRVSTGLGDPAQRHLPGVARAELERDHAEPVAPLLRQVADEALLGQGTRAAGTSSSVAGPSRVAICVAGTGSACRASRTRICSTRPRPGRGTRSESLRSETRCTSRIFRKDHRVTCNELCPPRPDRDTVQHPGSTRTAPSRSVSDRSTSPTSSPSPGTALGSRSRADALVEVRRTRAVIEALADDPQPALRRIDRLRRARHPAHPGRAADPAAAQPDPLPRCRFGPGGRTRGRPRADAAPDLHPGHRTDRDPGGDAADVRRAAERRHHPGRARVRQPRLLR